jgi:hypothetical protein
MNTFTILTSIVFFFYQVLPTLPGDGATDIDAVPIDNHILIGMGIAVLLAIFMIKRLSKTQTV